MSIKSISSFSRSALPQVNRTLQIQSHAPVAEMRSETWVLKKMSSVTNLDLLRKISKTPHSPASSVHILSPGSSTCQLAQLKEQFPSRFNQLFNDLYKQSHDYQNNKLHEECRKFLAAELKKDVKNNIIVYFPWALMGSSNWELFESEIQFLSFHREDRFKIYSALSQLAHSDVGEKSIQNCFVKILPDIADREERIEIGKAIVKIFKDFNFPERLTEKLSDYPGITQKENNPYLYYVLPICSQNKAHLPQFSVNRPLALGQDLQKYERILKALSDPNESMQIVFLSEIIAEHPENMCVLEWRSQKLYERGEYEGAIEDLDLILSRNPERFGALIRQAICYDGIGVLNEALANLNRALRLKPDSPLVSAMIAECQLRQETGNKS